MRVDRLLQALCRRVAHEVQYRRIFPDERRQFIAGDGVEQRVLGGSHAEVRHQLGSAETGADVPLAEHAHEGVVAGIHGHGTAAQDVETRRVTGHRTAAANVLDAQVPREFVELLLRQAVEGRNGGDKVADFLYPGLFTE